MSKAKLAVFMTRNLFSLFTSHGLTRNQLVNDYVFLTLQHISLLYTTSVLRWHLEDGGISIDGR